MGCSVLVAVLSIFAAVGAPMVRRLVIQARVEAVQNDLRAFSAAFQAYAAEHGDWPAGDGAPGAIPKGMESRLRGTHWEMKTPIGGHYAWDVNGLHRGTHVRAAVVITGTPADPVSSDRNQLHALDHQIDDAEFSTGNLFLGYRNWPVFVLEH